MTRLDGARAQPLGCAVLARDRVARAARRWRSGGAGRTGTPSTTPSTSSAGAGSSSAWCSTSLSVLARAWAWNLTIHQAMPPPLPRFPLVFSAFGVGLLGNAVLPARAGELARVAVLRRHVSHGRGTSATLLGTVFAHRLFDLFPIALLVGYVARDREAAALGGHGRRDPRARRARPARASRCSPRAAPTASAARPAHGAPAACDGAAGARRAPRPGRGVRGDRPADRGLGAAAPRRLGRDGGVRPRRAAPGRRARAAADEHRDRLPALAGNVGLLQAAVALPLVQYGVAYGTGFAYGLVLQALEMSVGVGVGLVMLAREGLSFAALKRMEDEEETSAEDVLEELEEEAELDEPLDAGEARHRGSVAPLSAPRRAAITVSAAAALGAWPVTAATNGSRSSATKLDVRRRRWPSRSAARRAAARSRRTPRRGRSGGRGSRPRPSRTT